MGDSVHSSFSTITCSTSITISFPILHQVRSCDSIPSRRINANRRTHRNGQRKRWTVVSRTPPSIQVCNFHPPTQQADFNGWHCLDDASCKAHDAWDDVWAAAHSVRHSPRVLVHSHFEGRRTRSPKIRGASTSTANPAAKKQEAAAACLLKRTRMRPATYPPRTRLRPPDRVFARPARLLVRR